MAAPQLLFFSSKSCKLCAKLSDDVRKVCVASNSLGIVTAATAAEPGNPYSPADNELITSS